MMEGGRDTTSKHLPTTFWVTPHGGGMARVTVVGAGLAGLATALYATTAGHHVVVLERSERLGGRATSQTVDGAPFGYGLHLLLKNGPLRKLVKTISRLPMALAAPRNDRLLVHGQGMVRPRNDVKRAALHRRALRNLERGTPVVQATALLAGSGLAEHGARLTALQKQRLCVVGEGWAGIAGRMASALDEVGVLMEPTCTVTSVEQGRVTLADGRTFESDVVVLACGLTHARRLLADANPALLAGVETVCVSTIDATLRSRPLGELHGVLDPEEQAYVLDLSNVQPRLHLEGGFLSAVMAEREGEGAEERLERLERFLDRHAPGWGGHVLHQRRQAKVVAQTTGDKPTYDACADLGILLAGEWVASEHTLADAAAETGRLAGQNIAKAVR